MIVVKICTAGADAHATGVQLRNDMLEKICGIQPDEQEFVLGEHGKPMLKNQKIEFSISHSGKMVACGVNTGTQIPFKTAVGDEFEYFLRLRGGCDQKIGIDIEHIRDFPWERIAKRYFSEWEQKAIREAENPNAAFARIWTRKESYGKWTGRGLAELSTIDTENPPSQIRFYSKVDCFRGEYYAVSVCYATSEEQEEAEDELEATVPEAGCCRPS